MAIDKLHHRKFIKFPILAYTGLLLLTHPVFAQDITLPETVITANRLDTPLEQVGSSMSVISSGDLEKRQLRTVSDALRDVPGFSVSRSGGVGSLTSVRLRGTEANQSLVVIDGVRVNDPGGNGYDFNSLRTSEIDRIEVLRGPASVLWGSDAIGGVINIVTRSAKAERQASLGAELGSFNTGEVAASAGTAKDKYDVFFSGSLFSTDGISSGSAARGNTEDDGADIGSLTLKTAIRPNEQLEFSLIANHRQDTSEFDAFVGGTDRPVTDSDEEAEKTQNTLRLEARHTALEGAWENILSAAGYDLDTETKMDGVTNFNSEATSRQFFYQSNYFLNASETDKGEHSFTLLLDHKEDETENSFFTKQSIKNSAAALNYNGGFNDKLFFTAGVRHDDNDTFQNSNTWRLSGAYLMRQASTRIHGSYGKAVKNPTLIELFGFSGSFQGNPNLKPETGLGWDIGVEQTFTDGKTRADLTYFDNRIEDLINGAGPFVTNLDGQSTARGLELSLGSHLANGLGITASYTYTDAEGPTGEALFRRPEHVASLIFNQTLMSNMANVNIAIRHVGKQQDFAFDPLTFQQSLVELDAFTLVNLNGSYKLNDRVELWGRVENVFDEIYEEVLGYGGIERGIYIGIKGRL